MMYIRYPLSPRQVEDLLFERNIAIVDGTNVLYERVAPDLEEGGWTVTEQRWHSDVVTELRERAEAGALEQ